MARRRGAGRAKVGVSMGRWRKHAGRKLRG
jgi:hypothetical protein